MALLPCGSRDLRLPQRVFPIPFHGSGDAVADLIVLEAEQPAQGASSGNKEKTKGRRNDEK